MLRRSLLRNCQYLLLAAGVAQAATTAAEKPFVAYMEDSSSLTVIRGGEAYLDLNLVAWGPNWSWLGLEGETNKRDGGTAFTNTAKVGDARATISLDGDVRQTGPRQLTVRFQLRASADVPLTYVVAALQPTAKVFKGGAVAVRLADGSTNTVQFPLDKKGLGAAVREFALKDAQGMETRVTLERPCEIPSDDAARIVLAANQLRQSEPVSLVVKMDLPQEVSFFASTDDIPSDPSFTEWYAFQPDENFDGTSYLSMEDWLERPAGKHGRIARKDEQLVYDGKPIKLWGVNVCYASCAPDKELAEKRAAFLCPLRHQCGAAA